MLTEHHRAFLAAARVGHLATADAAGAPHVVPVCYVIDGSTLYIAIDAKPKRGPASSLKRLANLAQNPSAAVVVDRYDEDWTRLAWVMLRGRAEILRDGAEHAHAQTLARARYPQLAAMDIAGLPVIALRIARVTSWGVLEPG
jgi:PPOX class probable F420-dependent enzyme